MYSSLCDFLQLLNDTTKLQIGIIFLGVPRHELLILPFKYTIHMAPYCWKMKSNYNNENHCLDCRNKAIRKAQKTMKPFNGMCVNGVWEYMHPIIIDNRVVGIIFIGNILRESSRTQITQRLTENLWTNEEEELLQTMAYETSEETCRQYAELIDSYFHLLYMAVPPKEHHMRNTLMIDLENFINENLFSNLNLENFSKTFHYNEKYLGRYFKKYHGCSLKEYICRKRIEQAKQLLADTVMPVSEIAVSTGFETIPYFNKRFRELTGMTPTDFRKRMQKNKQINKLRGTIYDKQRTSVSYRSL